MYMILHSLRDMAITGGMRVLVRADFDVALDGDTVADDFRVETALPTIRFLLAHGAHVRLIAHLGRPGGTKNAVLSLAPVARLLSRILDRKVPLIADPFQGDPPDGDLVLFENLRFWPGEERNDPAFTRMLAAHGDAYVNEAFAACHRSHASIVGLAQILPAYAGFHLLQEVEAMERVRERPRRPLVAVFGGAKIETKLPPIRRFLVDADCVIVGGALANTVLALRGSSVGKSAVDTGDAGDFSFLQNPKLALPSDVVVAPCLVAGAASRIRPIGTVQDDEYIADIGPDSRARFAQALMGANTVVWNGPMGYAEVQEFAGGTIAVAEAIQKLDAFTVVGGGDTIATLKRYGAFTGFSHVSTGGGAMLEFLSGAKLPGLEVLTTRTPYIRFPSS